MAKGVSDVSLDELMKDVAAKLDELPPPKPAIQPPDNILKDGDFPGLENLLNKASKHFEETSQNTESLEVSRLQKDGSGDKESDSLEDMLRALNKNIKSSNWLEENTAKKWVQDNPKLAEEYKKAAGNNTNNL